MVAVSYSWRLLATTAAIPLLHHTQWLVSATELDELAELARLIEARAVPNSPSGDYAPAVVDCPTGRDRPSIRSAAELSDQETDWLDLRRQATVDPMIDLLQRNPIADFDAAAYIRNAAQNNISQLPNIAIAVSGGGYRALMNGAGFLAAADSRSTDATKQGGIGGLLQASTYLAGLSGGGWLVGSMFANNFSTVETLRDGSVGSSLWKFNSSIFTGPDTGLLRRVDYWRDIFDQVEEKDDAGFETSLTDYWGRALSYQLINDTDGGPAYTFSSIADADNFKQAQTPFPILVADGRAPNEEIVSLNATVFEFNAFEMGTFDPTVYAFAPTKYLASNFSAGVIPSSGKCVRGFDQLGFIMGTSSSLFNIFLMQNLSAVSPDMPRLVQTLITDLLTSISDDNNDIAQYTPNPFLHYSPSTNPSANATELSLVDGGEDLQNIPLTPLLHPARAVDVIFAVDSSADTTTNWPNGTALRATYDRSLSPIANGTLFPPVPDANTFINKHLNTRPTFFGCSASNFSSSSSSSSLSPPPLIIYLPNAPYTALSNVSTFTPEYPVAQKNDMIRNGFDSATQGNGTVDAQWPTCVSCAIFSRSWWRSGTAVPSVCDECFRRYCWDGSLDAAETDETRLFEPGFIVGNMTTQELGSGGSAVVVGGGWGVGSLVAGGLALLLAL